VIGARVSKLHPVISAFTFFAAEACLSTTLRTYPIFYWEEENETTRRYFLSKGSLDKLNPNSTLL
jgi:hypothetical protein